MEKQDRSQRRTGSDRGGRREPVEKNIGRSRHSTAEKFAAFWPLAVVPALIVTYGLWHFLVTQNSLPQRVAVFAGIATAFVLNSMFTIWFYKTDKRLAEQQLRRIPEFSLHFWELFCGWPGALYAQKKYHHKWKKTSYMVVFYLYVVLNVVVVFGLFFPELSKSVFLSIHEALK